jgi:hypothetical protein
MKITTFVAVLLVVSSSCHAQWSNGIIMNVQEVDIAKMRMVRMSGAEAVLKIIEQFVDGQYRFAFVSYNYIVPEAQRKFLDLGKELFTIAVTGYPNLNNLLYTQVFYDRSFFFVVLVKNEADLKKSNDIQIIKMNYEKGNSVRRNNVRDTIRRNNTIPLGIDTAETNF